MIKPYSLDPQRVLLSPLFLASIAVLVLNDFFLKSYFGNFLTGKLSDLSGLFALPLFFTAFLPRRRNAIYVLTALVFTLWKTPLADGAIAFWNFHCPLQIGRTIDYGDLFAVAVLPLSYIYFRAGREIELSRFKLRNVATVGSVAFSLFAFTATSQVRDRMVLIDEGATTSDSISEIKKKVRAGKLVKSIDIRQEGEVYTDANNIATRAKTYLFDVSVDEVTCDSSTTSMTFSATENEDYTLISGGHIRFECPAYADESRTNVDALERAHKGHAASMFKRVVLDRLTPLTSQ